MANGLHSRSEINDHTISTTMKKSQSRSRRRRTTQYPMQSKEPPPRSKLEIKQSRIRAEEKDEEDPFYYYDLTSSSDTESESYDTHHLTSESSKFGTRSTSRGNDSMPEVREWQWVCCCCGKYNALRPNRTATRGDERCAGVKAGRAGKDGRSMCEHEICAECQDVETVVWRDEEKKKKGKR